jgi:hypothetical protein
VVFSRDNGGRRHRDGESDGGGRGGGAPSPFGSAATGGEGRFATDDYEEEKKHEDHHDAEEGEARTTPGRSFATASRPPAQSPKGGEDASDGGTKVPAPPRPAGIDPAGGGRRPPPRNPFDGWVGSTIRCAACRHVRPVRAAPFLCLSLPTSGAPSEFVEDLLAAEYRGFAAGAELVRDVRCSSCSAMRKAEELEGESAVLDGAISSILRRRRRLSGGGDGRVGDDADVDALVREHDRTRRKIAALRALDPDDDEDALDWEDDEDGDLRRGIDDPVVGGSRPTSRIVPVRGDAIRASLLMRPPEVLCVHIQRRHYDSSLRRITKVTRHVRFGERLDLGPYCAYGEASFEEEEEEDRWIVSMATTPRSDRRAGRTIPYELMSVIEHDGDAFGGHYQTYRRVDPKRREWVLVSDESVAPRTWNEVRRCQAYMLFYAAAFK